MLYLLQIASKQTNFSHIRENFCDFWKHFPFHYFKQKNLIRWNHAVCKAWRSILNDKHEIAENHNHRVSSSVSLHSHATNQMAQCWIHTFRGSHHWTDRLYVCALWLQMHMTVSSMLQCSRRNPAAFTAYNKYTTLCTTLCTAWSPSYRYLSAHNDNIVK